jgi:nitrogen fixation protein NifQ
MRRSAEPDAMEAEAAYAWLMDGAGGTFGDRFDAHVLASVLAVAIAETAAAGRPLSDGTGLRGAELAELVGPFFPHALLVMDCSDRSGELDVPEDERSLRELLARYASARSTFELHLATVIARRAMRPNHLWQDLGLRSRGELSALMNRHFTALDERNAGDMKWKKFFYRLICRDEGFRLCTAPSCAECDDFSVCFGDESGESLLARNRLDVERSIVTTASARRFTNGP